MTPALGELLPSAAAVALSPFPIIAVVVVLSAPRARSNGVAFAIGWLVGLSALSIVVVAAVGSAAADRESSPALAWARIAVGVALFALAVRRWRSRPAEDEEPTVPGWMASLDDLSPRKAVGIGMASGSERYSSVLPGVSSITFGGSAVSSPRGARYQRVARTSGGGKVPKGSSHPSAGRPGSRPGAPPTSNKTRTRGSVWNCSTASS